MVVMFDPLDIARYYILKGHQENIPISPMKLQKLIYFAHGWYLAFFDKSLLSEEIQAWKYGPVIPSVYNEFKAYGNSPISSSFRISSAEMVFNPEVQRFLDFVWKIYKKYTAIELSNLTHVRKSPWEITISKNGGAVHFFQVIDNELIKGYFKDVLEQAKTSKTTNVA